MKQATALIALFLLSASLQAQTLTAFRNPEFEKFITGKLTEAYKFKPELAEPLIGKAISTEQMQRIHNVIQGLIALDTVKAKSLLDLNKVSYVYENGRTIGYSPDTTAIKESKEKY